MTHVDHGDHVRSTGFSVPWGALSIGLATIAIGSLGTLVVIASIKDVDALSTVALALAVLAFAAQLIVSLAQANAGAQQISQAERINAATQSALADLRATSKSQLENQKEIFAQVLRAALPAVAQEISDEAIASDEHETKFDVAAIESRLESAINRALVGYPGGYQQVVNIRSDISRYAQLTRGVSARERRVAQSRLSRLSDREVTLLFEVVSRAAASPNRHIEYTLERADDRKLIANLHGLGYLETLVHAGGAKIGITLSEAGLTIGAYLLSFPSLPAALEFLKAGDGDRTES